MKDSIEQVLKRFDKKFKPFGFDLEEMFGGTSGVTDKLGNKIKQFIKEELTQRDQMHQARGEN